MDTHLDQSSAPGVSPEQTAMDEMVKLIIKLRWMGLEQEADCIENQLASCPIRAAKPVLAEPPETD